MSVETVRLNTGSTDACLSPSRQTVRINFNQSRIRRAIFAWLEITAQSGARHQFDKYLQHPYLAKRQFPHLQILLRLPELLDRYYLSGLAMPALHHDAVASLAHHLDIFIFLHFTHTSEVKPLTRSLRYRDFEFRYDGVSATIW